MRVDHRARQGLGRCGGLGAVRSRPRSFPIRAGPRPAQGLTGRRVSSSAAAYRAFRAMPARSATSATAGLSRAPAATSGGDLGGRRVEVDDALGRAGHDQRHLAADLLGRPGGELGERAADDLLVRLGQLAADRARPVRRRRPRPSRPGSRPSGAGPRRRPSSAARRPAAASRRDRSPALRDRKPSKQKRSTGSPDTASAVEHRGRPRDGGDPDARRDRGGDQPVAGVGHRGHARVGRHQDPRAVEQRRDELRRPGRLVALEVGHDPGRGGQRPAAAAARGSRRVSSAAMTSAPASSARSRGDASATSPIGVPARTRTPGPAGLAVSAARRSESQKSQVRAGYSGPRDAAGARVRAARPRRRRRRRRETPGRRRGPAPPTAPDHRRAAARPDAGRPAPRLGRHPRGHRDRLRRCGCRTSPTRTSWSSTRPTTPRTRTRC